MYICSSKLSKSRVILWVAVAIFSDNQCQICCVQPSHLRCKVKRNVRHGSVSFSFDRAMKNHLKPLRFRIWLGNPQGADFLPASFSLRNKAVGYISMQAMDVAKNRWHFPFWKRQLLLDWGNHLGWSMRIEDISRKKRMDGFHDWDVNTRSWENNQQTCNISII